MENILTIQEKEQILADMKKLLREYEYNFSNDALNLIIDTWAEQKADLIKLFKNHPNYVEGKFMIAFNQDWNRESDYDGVCRFVRWINANKFIVRDNHLPDHVKEIREVALEDYWGSTEHFNRYVPFTFETQFLYENEGVISHQFLSEDTADIFNNIDGSMRFKEGQKMSRAVNKICNWLGIDKLPDYNKEFAKYADAVNPLKIIRHTCISINPIDYLTMSFGNSWASCHTIDKENYRDMPNAYEGQYSSGTISYMLDKVSMVFYTVSASYDGDKYYFQDKINRCMFHYGKDKLVQGRVYPQDNDNNADNIYKDIREIVQKIIADCSGIPNYWTTKKGTDSIYRYVYTRGTHYADYNSFSNCCISFPKENDINEERITIGHHPICVSCGREHDCHENINHCAEGNTCEACGCYISDDDTYWVGDYAYCSDCVTWCDCCDNWEVNDRITYIPSESRHVCDECRGDYYTYCNCCEEYVRDRDATYLDRYEYYVCDYCLEIHYTKCDECENWIDDDDIHRLENEDGVQYLCDDCWEEVEEEEA